MTIGAWIFFGFIVVVITVGTIFICFEADNPFTTVTVILLAIVLTVSIFFGMRWYYQNTESGGRALKTQESNFNGGITRQVDVYDMEGDLLKTYKGKFDVEWYDDRILFDDEKGLRHVIYFSTGTIVVDEVGNSKEAE